MAGYNGYSMSNNAINAYDDGEMPLSKWTKTEIIEAVKSLNSDINITKLTVKQMKENLLTCSSWHHTSRKYNATDFYNIRDEVKNWTQDNVQKIIDIENKWKKEKEINDKNIKIAKELKKAGSLIIDGVKVIYIDDFKESQFTIEINDTTMLWSPRHAAKSFNELDNIFEMVKKARE